MKIIHIRRLIVFPCRTAKTGTPVIRLFSILCFTPDIIVTVRIVSAFSALHKPLMLIGAVIDYKIHDDLNAKFMRFCKHLIKIF